MPDYEWVTDAPITYVDPAESQARIDRFLESLRAYPAVQEPGEWARRMNAHIGGAADVCAMMAERLGRGWPFFEYKYLGVPVALMQLDFEEGGVEIKYLVTQPWTENAGGIMVEFALNQPSLYNQHGANLVENLVVLKSYNEDSTAAYVRLGFKGPQREMRLKPAKRPDIWQRVNGKWCMTRYHGKGYLKATV